MKRHTFRLATVLRVRRAEEDQARAALAEANRCTAEAETALTAREAAYAAHLTAAGLRTAAEFRRDQVLRDAAALAVRTATRAVDDARASAALRRLGYLDANRRVEALERYEEREREVWRHRLGAEEQRVSDDLVTARFARLARLDPEGDGR